MRIWDLNPGYLNRQSLLGEHRELHAIYTIIANNKKGYSRHPETLRWVGKESGLFIRHELLASEMKLRGYNEKSPIELNDSEINMPNTYIDSPMDQIKILKKKYIEKENGRIALPENSQELWRHHKYSVLARDVSAYKRIGKSVSNSKKLLDYSELAGELVSLLNTKPKIGGIKNALQHMWGYFKEYDVDQKPDIEKIDLKQLALLIQQKTIQYNQKYLLESTALSELYAWLIIHEKSQPYTH